MFVLNIPLYHSGFIKTCVGGCIGLVSSSKSLCNNRIYSKRNKMGAVALWKSPDPTN